MSPPCVGTMFEGDNGGATSRGVTGTEIAVAIPSGSRSTALVEALFEYFNRRFELYGRRLKPVFVSGSYRTTVDNRAVAATIAGQGVFATVTGHAERDTQPPQESFYQELARNGIVGVLGGGSQYLSDRTTYDQYHPYLWSLLPSAEDLERNIASFTCAALAGRVAQHAQDEALRSKARKFGVLTVGVTDMPWTRPLLDGLAACDADVVTADLLTPSATTWRTAMTSLREKGATTVICICDGYTVHDAFSQAAGASFFPEWLLTSAWGPDEEIQYPYYFSGNSQLFGVVERSRVIPYQAEPWFGAIQETNPKVLEGLSAITQAAFDARPTYNELLLLAAGIQGAGPALTPETFATALQSMQFPNPNKGAAPYYQPSAGFGPGDHSFYDDYALAWWNPRLEPLRAYDGARGGPGSWCYLDSGARWTAGTYPADADRRFFDPSLPCR